MKWIKASERLPKMETLLFLKIDGETMGIGNFYKEDQCYYLAVQKNGAHDGYIKLWYSAGNNTEWLDESPTEIGQQGRPILCEQFSDNGDHSHWHLINEDGEVLWSDFPEETIARGQKIKGTEDETINLLKKLSENRNQ